MVIMFLNTLIALRKIAFIDSCKTAKYERSPYPNDRNFSPELPTFLSHIFAIISYSGIAAFRLCTLATTVEFDDKI